MSMDLRTKDIVGAQAGTKGLGPFAEKPRQTMHNSVTTKDIDGAQAGTLKTGALSKRVTNPLSPDYPLLGRTQNARPDCTYAEPWKESKVRHSINRSKPEWKKSTVIPTIEDKKPETKTTQQQSDTLTAAANVRPRNHLEIGSIEDQRGPILRRKSAGDKGQGRAGVGRRRQQEQRAEKTRSYAADRS